MNVVKRYGTIYSSNPKELGEQEEQWLENLKTEISLTSEYKNNLLINLTWMEINDDEFSEWFKNNFIDNQTKVWFAGSIDGAEWLTVTDRYKTLIKDNIPVAIVGFAEDHWYSWLGPWFYNINSHIERDKLLLKKDFAWKYLNYNRKPRDHRYSLVSNLVENKLIDRAWITFEQGIFKEIDEKSNNSDDLYFQKLIEERDNIHWWQPVDDRFSRPEDHVSLGNLDIWQNSFLVVVTETEYDELPTSWHISEKTWKSIFGLRPYITISSPNVPIILEKLGFYTPAMLFNQPNLNDCKIETAVDFIKQIYHMSNVELYDMYLKMLPLLDYNRNRLKELSESDSTKILNWPQIKSGPWSTLN